MASPAVRIDRAEISPKTPAVGSCTASSRFPSIETCLIGAWKTKSMATTTAMATSGPGTILTLAGIRSQAMSTARAITPMKSAIPWLASGSAPGASALQRSTGIAAMFWRPLPSGTKSSMMINWPETIRTPIPASMPCMTAGEIARNHRPNLASAITICNPPASSTATPRICSPCSLTSSHISTVKPAAGPLTCSGWPDMEPTTIPPTMPVMSPSAGGTPEATATPRHSGSATRNTTTEAMTSFIK